MADPGQNHEQGFSLIELLIAMAISGILLGSIFTFSIVQRKYFATQEQVTEMMQNARAAMDMIVRDVRVAGVGAPKTNLASWVTWVSLTSNPQITQGIGSAPDSISILGVFDPPTSDTPTLTATSTTTTLTLSSSHASKFNTSAKKLVYIGNDENAVIAEISGGTLTIDKDPTATGNQPLTRTYPAGSLVELVKVITYEVVSNTLKRNENTGGGSQPVAENIEDLQITQTGTAITIALTARSTKPDPNYTHPTKGDHYRRVTLSSRIQLRN